MKSGPSFDVINTYITEVPLQTSLYWFVFQVLNAISFLMTDISFISNQKLYNVYNRSLFYLAIVLTIFFPRVPCSLSLLISKAYYFTEQLYIH